MKIYTVWNNNHMGLNENEKCIQNINGDYIGIKTGNIYSKDSHYASEQFLAKIISVDKENETGMIHLSDGNRFDWKSKYVGCIVTVEGAHYMGDLKIYRCLELGEYFSGNEVELIN